MSVYQNLMSQIHDAGLLFNVDSQSLKTAHGIDVPNKRALINTSNNQVMSVVSDTYKVVTNAEIYSSFCRSIEASGLDVEGATVNVKQTKNGSRAMVDFVFPSHEIRVKGDDSTTALQICALNSFDGSTRYMTKAGGLRMKCLNGQILGDVIGAYSSLHTKSLDVEQGADNVLKMIQDFQTASEKWGAMMKKPVSNEDAFKYICKFLNVKFEDRVDPQGEPLRESPALQNCKALWATYSRDLGRNAYALYNVFTDYMTHYRPRSQDPARRLISVRAKGAKQMDALGIFNIVPAA